VRLWIRRLTWFNPPLRKPRIQEPRREPELRPTQRSRLALAPTGSRVPNAVLTQASIVAFPTTHALRSAELYTEFIKENIGIRLR
jgi:hypothetical protein